MNLTREEVREIAESAADKAAEEAVRRMLIALGVNVENMHEEQQVWAFARQMHQGTRLGMRSLVRGSMAAIGTAAIGWIWWIFGPHIGGKP